VGRSGAEIFISTELPCQHRPVYIYTAIHCDLWLYVCQKHRNIQGNKREVSKITEMLNIHCNFYAEEINTVDKDII